MIKVAINGFGRIGRMILKAGIKDPKIDFVAVNDLTDASTLAYLFKHDSTHGKYPGSVKSTGDSIIIDGKAIKVLSEKDPAKLPWKKLGVDIVVESTGLFRNTEDIHKHIDAGAKKVLLSAPPKEDSEIKTIVMGVNDSEYHGENMVSNASCTTNCLAPIAKILNDKFTIKRGYMTTIHAYTQDQKLLDAPHKDLRRARSAAMSIIPTSTGAAKAIGAVIPELSGKMDGIAFRVPVPDGSITELVCEVTKKTNAEEINKLVKEAANGKMKGILEYSEDPLVSADIIGNSASSIFDSELTTVNETMVKVISWYDNEWGYSVRMIDLIKLMAK